MISRDQNWRLLFFFETAGKRHPNRSSPYINNASINYVKHESLQHSTFVSSQKIKTTLKKNTTRSHQISHTPCMNIMGLKKEVQKAAGKTPARDRTPQMTSVEVFCFVFIYMRDDSFMCELIYFRRISVKMNRS